jgi:hypothetical protein
MSERKTAHAIRRKNSAVVGVLGRANCDTASYHFEVPIASFNATAFLKATGIKKSQRWSAGVYPRDNAAGYHVHFNGRLTEKHAVITIEYKVGSYARPPHDSEPFAESIMQWLGRYVVTGTPVRAKVFVHFRKSLEAWRSRFNLPLKVPMGDAEVVIDGVSIVLPRNPARAVSAFVAREESTLSIAVILFRSLDFSGFNIEEEMRAIDDSTKLFLEPAI